MWSKGQMLASPSHHLGHTLNDGALADVEASDEQAVSALGKAAADGM